jgi:hypothetical protein
MARTNHSAQNDSACSSHDRTVILVNVLGTLDVSSPQPRAWLTASAARGQMQAQTRLPLQYLAIGESSVVANEK